MLGSVGIFMSFGYNKTFTVHESEYSWVVQIRHILGTLLRTQICSLDVILIHMYIKHFFDDIDDVIVRFYRPFTNVSPISGQTHAFGQSRVLYDQIYGDDNERRRDGVIARGQPRTQVAR